MATSRKRGRYSKLFRFAAEIEHQRVVLAMSYEDMATSLKEEHDYSVTPRALATFRRRNAEAIQERIAMQRKSFARESEPEAESVKAPSSQRSERVATLVGNEETSEIDASLLRERRSQAFSEQVSAAMLEKRKLPER